MVFAISLIAFTCAKSMNKILFIAALFLIGYPIGLWFEHKLIDAVPLQEITVPHYEKRTTMSLEVRQCRMHFEALSLQAYLDCRKSVKGVID